MSLADFNPRLRSQRDALRRMLFADDGTLNRDGAFVVAMLRDFCYFDRPTVQRDGAGRIDPLATAHAEGRREVFLRIMKIARLEDEQIASARHPEPADDGPYL